MQLNSSALEALLRLPMGCQTSQKRQSGSPIFANKQKATMPHKHRHKHRQQRNKPIISC
ncbi:MAG: hypothetical protein KME64_13300 [Scytonematopsis contorta HA4267-MV1]|jgi:hypothetical protein|nr:hypothetical protein [Scytonematopsis contorta HA4267-MV1]